MSMLCDSADRRKYLCKEQHGHKHRYERGQIMTFVYYREKTVPYLAHHNSLSERNVDSASRGQVYD